MQEDFCIKVYDVVKNIPRGYVTTYGAIAKLIGYKNYARQVGKVLHRNKNPNEIPCHRVVYANGKLSKSYAFGGESAQMNKLINEGVKFRTDNNGQRICAKQSILTFVHLNQQLKGNK